MVHLLLYDLPPDRDYRVVFMRRELQEVIKSQGVMLKRLDNKGAALSEEKLIAAYKDQLQRIDQWFAEQPNFHVFMVNYNNLMSEPEPVVQDLNEFIGGALDTQAMCSVIDPSLYRQRCS